MVLKSSSRTKLTIVYDLETTGFAGMPMFSHYHKVVQICAQCIETGQVFSAFVNPNFVGGIPLPSTSIHHISQNDVMDAPPIDLVLERMYRFFAFDKYETVEMIAHNNKYFDELMLMKEYKCVENNKYLPENVVFWDTLPWLRNHYPSLKSYSLGDLYKHFYKRDFENAHRADADVRALCEIYVDHIYPHRVDNAGDKMELVRKAVYDECITNIRFLGPWRALLCYKKANLQTVSQMVKFAQNLISGGDLTSFDRWLRDEIGIWNITQRLFIVSRILDIPIWFDELRRFINIVSDEDCLDAVDYYVKYRYVLNERAPNQCLYNRGLMNVFHKLS